MQAHAFGQLGVGADAHGHHHQVGRDLGAVLELQRHHAATLAAVLVANQGLGLAAHDEAHAALFQRLLQHLAGHHVELALHQRRHHVDHRHLHAALHQAVGRFQAQQAAADDHGVLVLGGRVDHGVGVGNVAVGDHAFQVLAGNRQDERVGAGGDQQAVVFGAGFLAGGIFGMHHAAHAVHLGHFPAGVQGDVVVGVPGPVVEHDLVQRLLTGQHRAQQDAVVVGVGLGTEDGDVVQVGRDLQQLFERAHTGHAVADHHQFLS